MWTTTLDNLQKKNWVYASLNLIVPGHNFFINENKQVVEFLGYFVTKTSFIEFKKSWSPFLGYKNYKITNNWIEHLLKSTQIKIRANPLQLKCSFIGSISNVLYWFCCFACWVKWLKYLTEYTCRKRENRKNFELSSR